MDDLYLVLLGQEDPHELVEKTPKPKDCNPWKVFGPGIMNLKQNQVKLERLREIHPDLPVSVSRSIHHIIGFIHSPIHHFSGDTTS